MTKRSVTHATFVIERTYPVSPARAFAAWSQPDAKASWFAGPPDKWQMIAREIDFRVGGREHVRGSFKGGPVSTFNSIYQDIVADERIVYSYDMHLDDVRISVSLATIEFKPADTGTRLVITEQGAFLDGYDDPGSRERGTQGLLDRLETMLR